MIIEHCGSFCNLTTHSRHSGRRFEWQILLLSKSVFSSLGWEALQVHCSAENIKAVRLAALSLLKLLVSLTNVGK